MRRQIPSSVNSPESGPIPLPIAISNNPPRAGSALLRVA